ncbi:MAG: AraC family transcriptional regulator ligand-binding domain-containing protein [Hellea sp.]
MKTLSVNYYFYVLKILEEMGIKRDEITQIAPFELESNRHPSVRVKMNVLSDLLTFAEDKLKNPHIGIHISHNFRISNYGYGGNIYALCEDIEHSMALVIKYGSLAHSLGRFGAVPEICTVSKSVKYIWFPNFPARDDELYKHITECILSNYALSINWLSWNLPKGVQKMTFRHAPIEPISEYDKVLNCEIEFGAAENSIILDMACHKAPLTTANPLKLSGLQHKLNQKLAAYNRESELIGRVKQILHEMIEHQRPTLALVAKDLSMTERTFKRQLKIQETRFQEILRNVKMELCDSYMKDGLAFSEIAQRLWYYDQSALTRAYKKWHGVSPTQNKRRPT